MSATGFTSSGGMMWHPYAKSSPFIASIRDFPNSRYPRLGGRWVHNPSHTLWTAWKGGNLATAVAQGNLMTRNFRQKPIVGLEKAGHKRVVKSKIVDIPTVSTRRTKNNLLVKNKAMPFRKTYRRKSYKKKGSRPRRRRVRTKRIPVMWARRKLVKMRMVWMGAVNCTTTSIGTIVFKANSLNDPSGTASAQLPLTLDTWAGMYSKYTIVGSKLVLKIHNLTSTGAIQVGACLKDDATTLSDVNYYKETGYAKTRMLTPDIDRTTFVVKYKGKKHDKVARWEDDDEYQGALSTSPGDPSSIRYYHLFLQDISGGNDATLEYVAEMDFYVLLSDPIIPTRSSL